jgi:AraC-like DNA-binding protein
MAASASFHATHAAAARTRVLRSAEGEPAWELWQRTPPAALAGLVAGLWAGSSPHAHARHRTLPNGELMLMLHLGPTQRLLEVGGRACRAGLGLGFVAGLQQRPATFECLEANTRVAAVRLLPVGGWLLLGSLPQAEIAGQVVEIDAVLGARSGVAALRERMQGAPDFGAALDCLERWLLERLARARAPHPAAFGAAARLRAVRGVIRVEGLASAAGLSPRRLHELFLREVGVPPKQLARILRFREALERLAGEPGADLARVALESGYCDQAHLYRDFRDLAAMTPLDYLAALGDGLDGPDVLSG